MIENGQRQTMRHVAPMPQRADVAVTVREDGTRDGQAVVAVTFTDLTGDSRDIHLSPQVALDLLSDLAAAYRQITHGP